MQQQRQGNQQLPLSRSRSVLIQPTQLLLKSTLSRQPSATRWSLQSEHSSRHTHMSPLKTELKTVSPLVTQLMRQAGCAVVGVANSVMSASYRMWGDVVKWGASFHTNTPGECCEACLKHIPPNEGDPTCNGEAHAVQRHCL